MKKYLAIIFGVCLIALVSAADVEISKQGKIIERIINLEPIATIIETFLSLTDTPSSYSGQGGQCVIVNAGETGLGFGNCSNATGGGGSGDITSVFGDEWITNGSVTGAVNLRFNVTKFLQESLNQTDTDGIYLNLSGTNANQDINITPYSLIVQNISLRNRLFFRDENHWIQINSSEMFDGDDLLQSTVWLHDQEDKDEGEIVFLITATSSGINRTLISAQVGRNNSAGVLGNSWMIVPNNLTQNLTIFSDCFLVGTALGKTLRIACDTSETGADLLVQDDIQANRLFADEGIRSENEANFLMNELDFDIIEGGLHLRNSRIEQVGFATGENATLFSADFSAGLSPFIQINPTGNPNEWTDTADDNCFDSPCARSSRILPPGNSIMQANITTTNFDTLNLSFRINTTNLDAGDLLNVTVNNNVGSNEFQVHAIADGADENQLVSVLLPATMDDRATVSLRYHCSVNVINEECFIDDIMIVGTATTNTQANITQFDTLIKGGSTGTEEIFILFNASVNEWQFSPNNISFQNISQTDLTIINSITLGGETITNWDNISLFDENILLTNGSRPLTSNWSAGDFNITADFFFGNLNWDFLTNLPSFVIDWGLHLTHLSNFTDDVLWTTPFNSTGDDRWLDKLNNENLSYLNNTNQNWLGTNNFTMNTTFLQRICLTSNCSASIYHNGSGIFMT